MEIKIDTDVPMPELRRKYPKFPVMEMEVGASFFAPGLRSSGFGAWLLDARKTGRKFTTRNATENGVDGVRVWRFE